MSQAVMRAKLRSVASQIGPTSVDAPPGHDVGSDESPSPLSSYIRCCEDNGIVMLASSSPYLWKVIIWPTTWPSPWLDQIITIKRAHILRCRHRFESQRLHREEASLR